MSFSKRHIYAYIGTYTEAGSKGIYTYRLEPETGSLEYVSASSELENPSYLTFSHDLRYLYAVSETESTDGVFGGAVASYMIEEHTGRLIFINSVTTRGSLPCHLSTDKANTHLFAANYGDGSLAAFRLNADGSIGAVASFIRHHGSGPDTVRQEKPHVHFTSLTPDEKYLCTVDLGIDKVMVYRYNPGSPEQTLSGVPAAAIKPGSGPRHLEFSRDGRFAWLINELSSDIVCFKYNQADPSFTEVQTISTLPDDFTENSYCAAIHASPDGNYLYASNRGHDSIAIFNIDQNTGRLSRLAITSTCGCWPRDFSIDPTGRFLFALNQNSSSIVSFRIIPGSGMLEPIGTEITVPYPVCIKFAAFE